MLWLLADWNPLPPRGQASLVAAGDIAGCWWTADGATARMVERIDAVVTPLGDDVYPSGSAEQFRRCYAPTWGRVLDRTRPIPGNHEYRTPGAAGYFGYFGARAGPPGRGYYSYDLDGWHVVALNSEVPIDSASPQFAWLGRDLAARRGRCILAYWHRPRFSSGRHGSNIRTRDAWALLQRSGGAVVLSGHDHLYERFAPLDADGRLDPRGMRQFVVGTGGAPLYRWGTPVPGSEVRNNRTHGVLKLWLRPRSYRWEFVPAYGSFQDSGQARCR